MVDYMNMPGIREVLGTTTFPKKRWESSSFDVNRDFTLAGEFQVWSMHHLSALLSRGVRTLIYAGEYDLICNWAGNLKAAEGLEWGGSEAFTETPLKDWLIDGQPRGKTKRAEGDGTELVFLTIAAAGHLMPHDKPVEALEMINTWLAGGQF